MIKALLAERGFRLYSQIWSDQASLLTQMLIWVFKFSNNDIIWSRRLSLIFSALMHWAVVQFLRIAWGDLSAGIRAFLLILLPNSLVLSTAVLVWQPSLAFAMVSMLALATWHHKHNNVLSILSALMYPLAWMSVAYLVLLDYQLLWWHHQVLVTIPAAMLAAGTFGEGIQLLVRVIQNQKVEGLLWALMGVSLILMGLSFSILEPIAIDYLHSMSYLNAEGRDPAQVRFMRRIEAYAPQTNWMVTDMPMYAFQAGIPVTPNLAVISWKRFAAGDLSEGEILETLKQYQPEQVLFGRFDLPEVNRYLEENYRMALQWDQTKLYLRKELQKCNCVKSTLPGCTIRVNFYMMRKGEKLQKLVGGRFEYSRKNSDYYRRERRDRSGNCTALCRKWGKGRNGCTF